MFAWMFRSARRVPSSARARSSSARWGRVTCGLGNAGHPIASRCRKALIPAALDLRGRSFLMAPAGLASLKEGFSSADRCCSEKVRLGKDRLARGVRQMFPASGSPLRVGDGLTMFTSRRLSASCKAFGRLSVRNLQRASHCRPFSLTPTCARHAGRAFSIAPRAPSNRRWMEVGAAPALEGLAPMPARAAIAVRSAPATRMPALSSPFTPVAAQIAAYASYRVKEMR